MTTSYCSGPTASTGSRQAPALACLTASTWPDERTEGIVVEIRRPGDEFRNPLAPENLPLESLGPAHYAEAERWALRAAETLDRQPPIPDGVAMASAFAAIGQIHATLAAASAAALHEEYQDIRARRQVTGQE